MSGSSSSDMIQEGEREPVIEVQLAVSPVDNKKLQEEIQNLKVKLEQAEGENKNLREGLGKATEGLKNRDEKIKKFTEIKVAVKRMYAVAKAVLGALLGEKDDTINRNYKIITVKVIDKLCDDLQENLMEWQRNHQLLHDRMEEAVSQVTDLDEKLDPWLVEKQGLKPQSPLQDRVRRAGKITKNVPKETPIVQRKRVNRKKMSRSLGAIPWRPSSSVVSARSSVISTRSRPRPRRNPVRQCRFKNPPQACFPAPRTIPAQFTCDRCGTIYSRLRHVCSRMEARKNQEMIPDRAVGGRPLEMDTEIAGSSSQESDRPLTQNNRDGNDLQAQNWDSFVQPRPPMVVVDSSGQEHRFSGARKTIMPSEQRKAMLEGSTPTKETRHFCKCGRSFQNSNALYNHITFIKKGNIGTRPKCGLCKQEFAMHAGLQTHLRTEHGVEYCRGRFACLECGEDFRTNEEIVNHQMVVHGKVNNNANDNDENE